MRLKFVGEKGPPVVLPGAGLKVFSVWGSNVQAYIYTHTNTHSCRTSRMRLSEEEGLSWRVCVCVAGVQNVALAVSVFPMVLGSFLNLGQPVNHNQSRLSPPHTNPKCTQTHTHTHSYTHTVSLRPSLPT